MDKNVQRVLAIVVLLLITALVEGEVVRAQEQTELQSRPVFGRTLVVINREARLDRDLKETFIAQIKIIFHQRRLGTVVEVVDGLRSGLLETKVVAVGAESVLEIRQGRMVVTTNRGNTTLTFSSQVRLGAQESLAEAFITARVLQLKVGQGGLQETAIADAYGDARGYTGNIPRQGLFFISGTYTFTSKEALKREALIKATRTLIDGIVTMSRADGE